MPVVREAWLILNALATYHLNWQAKGDEYVDEHQQSIVNYEHRLLDSLRKWHRVRDWEWIGGGHLFQRYARLDIALSPHNSAPSVFHLHLLIFSQEYTCMIDFYT